MTKTPHAKLRKEITDYLTSIGAWWYCTNSQGYGRKGIPDVIGFWRGMGFAIEVKVAPDSPSPWQERELTKIAEANAVAICAYSLKGVQEYFTDWAKRTIKFSFPTPFIIV